MNTMIFYFTSTVWALGGFWILWQFGVRPLMLDTFRDSLFLTRDRLYRLAQQGMIECDSEAYRTIETLLNRLIRYAHRLTFSSFMLTQIREDKDSEAFADTIAAAINAVPNNEARQELLAILFTVNNLIPRYAGKSSIFFMLLSLVYFATRTFQPIFARTKKKQAVLAFEREVFFTVEPEAFAGA